jgi:hypothetical protein
MKIKEFLRGPLPDDALQELEAKFGGPLTRLYVVGFKGRYVNPDGKAEEVLSRFGLLVRAAALGRAPPDTTLWRTGGLGLRSPSWGGTSTLPQATPYSSAPPGGAGRRRRSRRL